MRPVLVAVLALFAAAVVLIQALSVSLERELPDFAIRTIDANQRVVTYVSAQAAAAGLRAGDRYDWSRATPAQRAQRWGVAPGDALELPVVRDGKVVPVRLVPNARAAVDQFAAYADAFLKLIGIGIALLLVARGRGRFGFLAGVFLFGIVVKEGFNVSYAVLGPASRPAFWITVIIGQALAYCGVEAMIELCRPTLKRWEIAVFRTAGVMGTLFVLPLAAGSMLQIGTLLAAFDPLFFAGQLLVVFTILAGYTVAVVRGTLPDRALLRWVLVTSLFGWSGNFCNLISALLNRPILAYGALNLTLFIMVFGYAYVSLRYRIVNISFVVNRAVVYAVLIGLIVAAFTLGETVVTKLALSRVNSLVVEFIFALGVAYAAKPAERAVDRIVERLLFARKHATEQGLRDLIHDCPHVDDPESLLQNVCAEVRRLTGAEHVLAYERINEALVPAAASPAHEIAVPVSINDAVVVRLRSARRPVVLGEMRSTLGSAGTAFPMLSRGRLVGVIVCADRSGRRSYDPDERELLAELAREVGTSLLFLRIGALRGTADLRA